jgi:hypothetical protein
MSQDPPGPRPKPAVRSTASHWWDAGRVALDATRTLITAQPLGVVAVCWLLLQTATLALFTPSSLLMALNAAFGLAAGFAWPITPRHRLLPAAAGRH